MKRYIQTTTNNGMSILLYLNRIRQYLNEARRELSEHDYENLKEAVRPYLDEE